MVALLQYTDGNHKASLFEGLIANLCEGESRVVS